jgi:hypothetical protein
MDKRGYWNFAWTLDWSNQLHRDRLDGVTFDVALRVALEWSAKIFVSSTPSH